QALQVARQRHLAGRAAAKVRGGDLALVGDVGGLHRGHPRLAGDPRPAGRRVPADPEHLPFPARQSLRLRPPAGPPAVRAAGGGGPLTLDRLARLIDRVTRAYDQYQFHTVFHTVHNFCAVDLSALYLDVIKDRLYTSAPGDPR